MTMKEFKKYLDKLINDYEQKDELYGIYTDRYINVLVELKDIRKVINS